MRISQALRNTVWIVALCLCAQEQQPPAKDAPANETKGLPPRLAPTDYQAQAHAGTVTIAADFVEHGIPTPQGVFSTEDYVVVEAGLYGPAQARLKLSANDFSLRINGKKVPLPSQPFGLVFSSAKDPSWEPPEAPSSKSKTGISAGGGGGGADSTPPAPVHMPMPLQHVMQQKIQKAALPEGDRPLPQAGLLFFSYHGLGKGIYSVELIYNGPAGKATLSLHP